MSNMEDKQLAVLAAEWLRLVALEKENERTQKEERVWGSLSSLKNTTWFLGILQIALIILFATVGGSEIIEGASASQASNAYSLFTGIEIMMFIGFGYIMTFLKWYGLSAVGFTMLITAIGLQWYLFCDSFWFQMYNTENNPDWTRVPVNMYCLMNALFGVTAVLISFGGLIGKVSPFQLVILTVIELCCHACNYRVFLQGIMRISDVGGTYIDHMFGAYFGLSVAYVLGRPKSQPQLGNVPDVYSLLGTLFLWVYFPSFVAGSTVEGSVQQQTALVNTVLALSASTIGTFWISALVSKTGRYRPVDIQNATLAGGVAIGAAANMNLNSFSAIMIGVAAGIVSCLGYNFVQPWLEANFGLHDTCGVHNLHGMPSIVGAIASVIVSGYQQSGDRNNSAAVYGKYKNQQWWRQWVSILFTLGFAIASGLLTGFLLKAVGDDEASVAASAAGAQEVQEFQDEPYWQVADDYNSSSVFAELARVVQGASKRRGGSAVDGCQLQKEVGGWSGHGGRRNLVASRVQQVKVAGALSAEAFQGAHKPVTAASGSSAIAQPTDDKV